MREIRLSGSEGGGDHRVSPYPYQSASREMLSSQPLSLISEMTGCVQLWGV